jgi:hypothetical protein
MFGLSFAEVITVMLIFTLMIGIPVAVVLAAQKKR